MYFDNFTLGAIAIFVAVVVLFYVLNRQQQSETRLQLDELHTRMQNLHREPSVHSKAAREMCAAIHHLYPHAVAGEDFQLADDGNGPYINAWMLADEQPSAKQLAGIYEDHREQWQGTNYREARLAEYPSIGEQLDAMYKARRGDDSALRVVDEIITEVKGKHPNVSKC